MNSYPVWWDTTLTLYNKYENPTTNEVSWFRTVLTGCFWKYVGNKINIGDSTIETKDTICRVRKNPAYLDKYLWMDADKTTHFTLGKGDILVKGEVQDTIDEYTEGQRSTDLLNKYKEMQGCIEITTFADNTGAGRCSEHYLIKGE